MLRVMSLRVLFAFSSSIVVTAAIAGPMGYQAHQARTDTTTTQTIPAEVLGTTSTKVPTTDAANSPSSVPETAAPTTTRNDPSSSTPTTSRPRTSTTIAGRSTVPTTAPRILVRPPDPPATTTPPPIAPTTTARPAAPTTTARPSTTSTTTPAVLAANLFWSTSGPSKAEGLLDGATLSGRVFIFAEAEDVIGVEFQLDGEPASVENLWPWELLGGSPLDTARLDPGEHVVTASIDFVDGVRAVQRATFTVDR